MAQTGTVRSFDRDQGVGYISPDEGGSDVFVSRASVEQSGLITLPETQKVSFEVENDPQGKGPLAVNIRLS